VRAASESPRFGACAWFGIERVVEVRASRAGDTFWSGSTPPVVARLALAPESGDALHSAGIDSGSPTSTTTRCFGTRNVCAVCRIRRSARRNAPELVTHVHPEDHDRVSGARFAKPRRATGAHGIVFRVVLPTDDAHIDSRAELVRRPGVRAVVSSVWSSTSRARVKRMQPTAPQRAPRRAVRAAGVGIWSLDLASGAIE